MTRTKCSAWAAPLANSSKAAAAPSTEPSPPSPINSTVPHDEPAAVAASAVVARIRNPRRPRASPRPSLLARHSQNQAPEHSRNQRRQSHCRRHRQNSHGHLARRTLPHPRKASRNPYPRLQRRGWHQRRNRTDEIPSPGSRHVRRRPRPLRNRPPARIQRRRHLPPRRRLPASPPLPRRQHPPHGRLPTPRPRKSSPRRPPPRTRLRHGSRRSPRHHPPRSLPRHSRHHRKTSGLSRLLRRHPPTRFPPPRCRHSTPLRPGNRPRPVLRFLRHRQSQGFLSRPENLECPRLADQRISRSPPLRSARRRRTRTGGPRLQRPGFCHHGKRRAKSHRPLLLRISRLHCPHRNGTPPTRRLLRIHPRSPCRQELRGMTKSYLINSSLGGRGFNPRVVRFHAAVIPNPRAFCGVRDLLFACSLRSREGVTRAGWLTV